LRGRGDIRKTIDSFISDRAEYKSLTKQWGEIRVSINDVDAKKGLRQLKVRRLFRRSWFYWITGACCVFVAFWVFGGFSALLNRAASEALGERDYERADQILTLIDRFRCETPQTIFLKARLRRKQLRTAEVPELLRAADKAGLDSSQVRREFILLEAQSGGIRNVADELNSLLQQGDGDGAEICEAYVNGAMMIGATDVAMTILPVWKQEFPEDPQPHYAHARILEYQQKVEDAIRELQTAIAKHSRHWPSRYALGRILYGENRIEESLQQLTIATEMRANAAPLFQRARCLRSLGRLSEAHQILLKLSKLDKPLVQKSFALVCEPERGLPIEYELGTLEAALGNHEAAKGWLEIVLKADRNHLDARYARALSLRELGQSSEADLELAAVHRIRTLLQEIDRLVDEINRSPDEPHLEARCRIGELYIKYENARHGEFWLQEALNRDPTYRPAHAILADYYDSLKSRRPEYSVLAENHRKAAAGNNLTLPKGGATP